MNFRLIGLTTDKQLAIVLLLLWAMSTPLISCSKKAIVPEEAVVPEEIITETPEEEEPAENEQPTEEPEQTSKIVLSGDSNGKLVIDGSTAQYDCQTLIAIKGGTYTSIQIKNLTGKEGCPIQITNDGLVEVVGFRNQMSVSNVSHIAIRGNGNSELKRGFLFRDNEYRAITLDGKINHIELTHIEFKNIGNYVISYNNETIYDGSPDSYSTNLTFSYLTADNTGSLINFGGGITGGNIRGLVKNLEVSHVKFTNAPHPRHVIYAGMAVDYQIHHNEFLNVNASNDDHNGICFLRGNGRFYNNYVKNHQGNALRAWVVSVGTTPKEVLVYNNIVVNSRKYSAFEVQSFSNDMVPGKTTFVNAKIFHNTCGNLNLSKDWYGVIVDAYRLFGGTCQVFNNLAFSLPAPHPASNFVSYMSIEDGKLSATNNLYFETSKAAGIIDENEFKLNGSSKAKNYGMNSLITRDFYGALRNDNTPSIGAVE